MEQKENLIDYLAELPNYLSWFIIPVYFTTASTMLLEMSKSFNISTGNMGLIFTFFTVGLVLGQLSSVIYNKKFKKVIIIVGAYSLIVPLLVILGFSRNLYLFYVLYFLIGYLSGLIQIQSTKFILENKIKNKDRLVTILFFFYPIGSLIAPLFASSLIKNKIDWHFSYFIMASVSFLILILYVIMKWRASRLIAEEEEKISFKQIFFDRKKNIIFALGSALMFFYCISETVIATWSPTFLRAARALDIRYAGLTVAIFWLGILVGRIIVSFFAGKHNPNIIMLFLSVLAFSSLILFVIFKSKYATLTTSALAGLGCSGISTIGVSSASTIYERGGGILATIIFAVNYVGISISPFLTRISSRFNMTFSIILAPVFMLMVFVVIIIKIVYEKNTKAKVLKNI
jgi:MFS transporter, FHS family, glucose/mannose:H+ symporter